MFNSITTMTDCDDINVRAFLNHPCLARSGLFAVTDTFRVCYKDGKSLLIAYRLQFCVHIVCVISSHNDTSEQELPAQE